MTDERSLLASRYRGPIHSTKWAARAWWWLLPYAGIWGYKDDVDEFGPNPNERWWWRFTFLHYCAWRLVSKLPSSAPFEPMEPIVCNCDYCRGVPGAVFEP